MLCTISIIIFNLAWLEASGEESYVVGLIADVRDTLRLVKYSNYTTIHTELPEAHKSQF